MAWLRAFESPGVPEAVNAVRNLLRNSTDSRCNYRYSDSHGLQY